jgi:predicted nucleic acid-binding Zn ribbon protein
MRRVPNYSFCCTNTACQHQFSLHLHASDSKAIQFCPVCSSVTKRDASDFATVRAIKEKQFHDYPDEARDLQRFVNHHVHGPGCGCVLNHNNEYAPTEPIGLER